MNKKIIIKIVVIVILLVIILIQTFNKLGNNKKKYEEYEIYSRGKKVEFIDEQEVDGLLFQQISYLYDPNKGCNYYDIVVTNVSGKLYELNGFEVIIKDKEGKKVNGHVSKVNFSFEDGDRFKYTIIIKDDILLAEEHEFEYKPKREK